MHYHNKYLLFLPEKAVKQCWDARCCTSLCPFPVSCFLAPKISLIPKSVFLDTMFCLIFDNICEMHLWFFAW